MDAILYVNGNHFLNDWCKHFGHHNDQKNGIVHFNNGMSNLLYDGIPDPDEDWEYPNYNFDINVDHEIYMFINDKPSTEEEFIEQINFFYSLTAYVCKYSDSDVLMYFEDSVPLVYRSKGKLILGDYVIGKDFSMYYLKGLKNFDGMDYTVEDLNKYYRDQPFEF